MWKWRLFSCVQLDLYSPRHPPGQNTGVGSLSLLQGVFPTQGSNPGLLQCRQILYQLSKPQEKPNGNGQPIPSPADLPDPGIELGSPELQEDSLPTELSGKSNFTVNLLIKSIYTCFHFFTSYFFFSLLKTNFPSPPLYLINWSMTTSGLAKKFVQVSEPSYRKTQTNFVANPIYPCYSTWWAFSCPQFI